MKSKTWEIYSLFEKPLGGDKIKLVDTPLEMPAGVDEIIKRKWDGQLAKKKGELDFPVEIKDYDGNLNALWRGDANKWVMWPGPVITFKDVKETDIYVSQMSYPYITSLKDPDISKLFEEQNIEKPRPSLGICTFPVTTDNMLLLTVRGIKTNVYPGRYYTIGGNPQCTNTDVVEHQIEEMEEEIFITPSEYNTSDYRFAGVVIDNEGLPGKPDLVGWIEMPLSSEEMKERLYSVPKDERANDVVDIAFVPATEDGLAQELSVMDPHDFCPPAHAALFVYGIMNFGKSWADSLPENIEF